MNEQTDAIYKALNALCKALDLNGESGTEELFLILATVFDDENTEEMEAIRQDSNNEGLMYNMLWPIAEKIKAVRDDRANSVVPPWMG